MARENPTWGEERITNQHQVMRLEVSIFHSAVAFCAWDPAVCRR